MQKKMKIALIVMAVFVFSATMGILFGEREPEQETVVNNSTADVTPLPMTLEEYADLVGSQSIRIANAFEAIRLLGTEPNNDNWFVDLLNETTIILNACNEAMNMKPPDVMKEAHQDYLEGIMIANEAASKLKQIALSFEIDDEARKVLNSYQSEMEKAELPIKLATNKIKMALQKAP